MPTAIHAGDKAWTYDQNQQRTFFEAPEGSTSKR